MRLVGVLNSKSEPISMAIQLPLFVVQLLLAGQISVSYYNSQVFKFKVMSLFYFIHFGYCEGEYFVILVGEKKTLISYVALYGLIQILIFV